MEAAGTGGTGTLSRSDGNGTGDRTPLRGESPRRRPTALPAALLALAALLAAAGCRRHPASGPDREPAGAARAAVIAAEAALRNTVPNGAAAQFRGLRAYDQAMPGRWAVCGQVSPFKDDPVLFVPFVAVASVDAGGRATPPDVLFAGTSVDAADRTWAALITHCYEKGGPASDPVVRSVPPLPPLPNAVPAPPAPNAARPAAGAPPAATGEAAPPAGPATVPGMEPAGGSAVTRQNVNLHDGPHGAVTRVVPQGTALHVFGTAPGGWLQVGDAAPWGWIHESMLDRR